MVIQGDRAATERRPSGDRGNPQRGPAREPPAGASEGIPGGDNTFFAALENWWLAEREAVPEPRSADLPFAGGWAIFLSYEMAQEVEPRLSLPRSSLPWRAFALRTPCALIHDRTRDV